jgi:hypothetical protein
MMIGSAIFRASFRVVSRLMRRLPANAYRHASASASTPGQFAKGPSAPAQHVVTPSWKGVPPKGEVLHNVQHETTGGKAWRYQGGVEVEENRRAADPDPFGHTTQRLLFRSERGLCPRNFGGESGGSSETPPKKVR